MSFSVANTATNTYQLGYGTYSSFALTTVSSYVVNTFHILKQIDISAGVWFITGGVILDDNGSTGPNNNWIYLSDKQLTTGNTDLSNNINTTSTYGFQNANNNRLANYTAIASIPLVNDHSNRPAVTISGVYVCSSNKTIYLYLNKYNITGLFNWKLSCHRIA
jgi:hypothetical protein